MSGDPAGDGQADTDGGSPGRDPLSDARILLGVTGGIAAYKAAAVARLLVGRGAAVDTVLTRGAHRFVGPATFEGITGRSVGTGVFDEVAGGTHVGLARAASAALVYPATAHLLARAAGGLADDLLTTSLLAATCPVVMAPAMHTEMWEHAATRDNVATLRRRGVTLVGPAEGPLMGGDTGPGRAVEPEAAVAALTDALGPGADLAGRRVVVTAGGTREPLDPVRHLGNRATGRMGFAVARAAARRGAEVVLIAGPAELATPAGVTRVDVTTAQEMQGAVEEHRPGADVIVKAAAVADFRPATTAREKIKKDRAGDGLELELVRTPDILAELGRLPDDQRPLLVGFAAETDDPEANGRAKLGAKGADLMVVNDVGRDDAGFATEENAVLILGDGGLRVDVPLSDKLVVADRLLDQVATRLQ